MMKKIFFLIVCCLFLCGCDKNNGYQVSELTPNTDVGLSHLKGTIKNVSNDNCKKVKINVTFSSGTIVDDGWIVVDSPDIGKTTNFNESFYGAPDTDDIENYKIELKSIECWDF